ncbi:MAG: HAMP domain-containing protein [Chitinivibrionales bacterium]|nr:HAMP domain-containing protein [Chitinivibrionales bacterium]
MQNAQGKNNAGAMWRNMGGSLRTKMFIGFGIVTTLALISALAGIYGTFRVGKAAEKIQTEQLPFVDISMEAIISAEKTMNQVQKYLAAYDKFDGIETEITENNADIEMFLMMARHGTSSNEFKKSASSERYQTQSIDIEVPASGGEIRKIAEQADAAHGQFKTSIHSAIDLHKKEMELFYNESGDYLDLPAFIAQMEIAHSDFVELLEASVEKNRRFTGEVNPNNCRLGKFIDTYVAPNKAIAGEIQSLIDTHEKLHVIAGDMQSAQSLHGKRIKLQQAKKMSREVHEKLSNLYTNSQKLLNDIQKNLATNLQAMTQAALAMNERLEELEMHTAGEMETAMRKSSSLGSAIITGLIILSAIGLAIAILLSLSITRMITKPIQQCVNFATAISSGDLTQSLTSQAKDETGKLVSALGAMRENLVEIITNLTRNSSTLAQDSSAMSSVATQISASAEEMSTQANAVASSTEQATANVQNMSASATQMSTSVTTVATAIEEMSSSLNEVARSCQQESEKATEADAETKNASGKMDKLGETAKQIGKIIDVIKDIADQTNLLALNATIEAASAGDAGKGFAVVANEVKELAKQTAQATGEIENNIKEIQTASSDSISAISRVESIISEVHSISQTIVSAVEEQSATVNEISSNVTGASSAANEIAHNVAETATGLTEVSQNIHGVNEAASETANGINEVSSQAEKLNVLSGELKEIVGKFKIS